MLLGTNENYKTFCCFQEEKLAFAHVSLAAEQVNICFRNSVSATTFLVSPGNIEVLNCKGLCFR